MLKVMPDDTETMPREAFTKQATPKETWVALNIFTLLVLIQEIVALIVHGDEYYPELYVILLSKCFISVCAAAILVLKYRNRVLGNSQRLEHWFSMLLCITVGVILTVEEFRGDCHSMSFIHHCSPLHSKHYISPTSTMILSLLPVGLELFFVDLSWQVLTSCCIICFGFLLLNIVIFSAFNSATPFVLALLFDILALICGRMKKDCCCSRVHVRKPVVRQHSFPNTSQAPSAIDDKDKRLNVVQSSQEAAREWRDMLSNIAHDLNTPLSAINGACDLLFGSLSHLADSMRDRRGMSRPDLLRNSSSVERMTRIAPPIQPSPSQTAISASPSRSFAPETRMEDFQSALLNLRFIRSSVSYMSMMLHRCIDFAKADHGMQLVPFLEVFNVRECIEKAVNCVRDLQPHCHVEIIEWPKEMSELIRSDYRWLFDNVLCLVGNSVKYGFIGELVTIRLSINDVESGMLTSLPSTSSAYLPNNSLFASTRSQIPPLLRIEIQDRSHGIEPRLREKIFTSEFRHSQRLSGGTGLGLYALACRCKALGGSCGVEDRPDQLSGSIFWITIPFLPEKKPRFKAPKVNFQSQSAAEGPSLRVAPSESFSRSEDNIQLTTSSMGGAASPGPRAVLARIPSTVSFATIGSNDAINLTVLVVDDSLPILKMTKHILERDGHQVIVANNGLEAVQIWESKQYLFDAIVMDIQMPVMDGLEATRRIRAWEVKHHIYDSMSVGENSGSNSQNKATSYSRRANSLEEDREEEGEGEGEEDNQTRNLKSHWKKAQLIIGCSANADERTVEDAYEAGVNCFLPKPFRLDAFKAVVNTFYFSVAST